MAKQNEYEVNTDKSVRQLDQLEKKISRVDSLFERAQRRGTALGKMNIAPTLALNDKLSDHLTRIENRLQGLNRTTISPSLHIADRATAEIAGVAAYLKTVTETKWMINFEAISWGKLFSGSFSDWLKGQNLMTSIKEQLSNPEVFQESGTLAGQQFFQSFLEAIDPEQIAEKFKELELNANVNLSGGSDSDSGWGGFWKDVLKDSISGTASGLLTAGLLGIGGKIGKKINKNKKFNELKKRFFGGDSGNNENKHIENKKTPSTKTEKFSFSNTVDKLKETKEWGEKNLKKFGNFLSETGGEAKKFIKGDSSLKLVPDLTKGIDYKGYIIKPIPNLSDYKLKISKGIALYGLLMDATNIITAESGKERSKAVGSSIGSSIGAGVGGFFGTLLLPGYGTAAGAILGSDLGSGAGQWVAGIVHDLIYGKDSSTVSNNPEFSFIKTNVKEKIMDSLEKQRVGAVATGILPTLISSTQPSPVGNIGIPGVGSSTRVPSVPFGFVPTPPTPITPTATMQKQPEVQKQILDPTIQVNLPVGAVQLTVNQPELNYDQIASVVGTKITSSVQLAWQNTKLR